ncbi:MAG: alpha/beta fold hydrolase [Halolamina sp.]
MPDRGVSDAGAYLTAVLDDVGVESAGVLGFSGGGAHALALAATSPERVDAVDVIAGVTPPSARAETPMPQRVLSWLAGATPTLLAGLFRGQAWLAGRLDPSFVLAQYTDEPESITANAQHLVTADFCEAFAASRSGAVTDDVAPELVPERFADAARIAAWVRLPIQAMLVGWAWLYTGSNDAGE